MLGLRRRAATCRFAATLCLLGLSHPAWAQNRPNVSDWSAVVESARGETVDFAVSGGAAGKTAFLQWVADEVKRLYAVELRVVTVQDRTALLSRIETEKTTGGTRGNAIDLMEIDSEGFAAMKMADLLEKRFAMKLPNWQFVDLENQPSVITDATLPTDGSESPLGREKLVFFTDIARDGQVEDMPDSAAALLQWAKDHPGSFAYPAPSDPVGMAFLQQILFETMDDPSLLARPARERDFATVTAPLWHYLDELKPVSWKEGRDHPASGNAMLHQFAAGELGIVFSLNPGAASAAIRAGELPDTARGFVFAGGTLGGTHFVAIPAKADARSGALVVANFLLSPEAQLHKEDPAVWGDPTVLSPTRMPEGMRQRFEALDRGPATLQGSALGLTLPEPHPSWSERLAAEWQRRYAGG